MATLRPMPPNVKRSGIAGIAAPTRHAPGYCLRLKLRLNTGMASYGPMLSNGTQDEIRA